MCSGRWGSSTGRRRRSPQAPRSTEAWSGAVVVGVVGLGGGHARRGGGRASGNGKSSGRSSGMLLGGAAVAGTGIKRQGSGGTAGVWVLMHTLHVLVLMVIGGWVTCCHWCLCWLLWAVLAGSRWCAGGTTWQLLCAIACSCRLHAQQPVHLAVLRVACCCGLPLANVFQLLSQLLPMSSSSRRSSMTSTARVDRCWLLCLTSLCHASLSVTSIASDEMPGCSGMVTQCVGCQPD